MPSSSTSIKSLKKKADAVFSLYIRQRDHGTCITCSTQKPIAQMQAGHFIRRSITHLRFDEQNVNCQCVGCNIFKHGNLYIYGLKLDQKYGAGTAARLSDESQQFHKFTTEELLDIIETFKRKSEEINESYSLYD